MNQQQIYAKKQKALERKIAKMKAEQEQLQTEQRQYEQASKIADSHILRLKDYVIANVKANMSAENLKRWAEIFQTIYGYVESPKTENSEFETSEFSEITPDFSEKEIATAKENEDTLQLEIPLETED
jgi:multidrug efflux pump subunit AcrA (membrane-fusion protein)